MLSVDGDCGWTPLRPQWVLCFRKDSRGIQLGLRKANSEIRLLASFRLVCFAICVLVSRPLAVGLACWCGGMLGLEEEGGSGDRETREKKWEREGVKEVGRDGGREGES